MKETFVGACKASHSNFAKASSRVSIDHPALVHVQVASLIFRQAINTDAKGTLKDLPQITYSTVLYPPKQYYFLARLLFLVLSFFFVFSSKVAQRSHERAIPLYREYTEH